MKKFLKELWSFFWNDLDRKQKCWALLALPLFFIGFAFGFLFMPLIKGVESGADAFDEFAGRFLR